jgi:hypothetical protein
MLEALSHTERPESTISTAAQTVLFDKAAYIVFKLSC